MNKQKTIFFLIGIAFISIFAIVYFSFNAPREDISSEKANFILTTDILVSEFEKNESVAEKKYKNLIIEISGQISEINENGENGTNCILKSDMMSSVICEFEPGKDKIIRKYTKGDSVIILGKYSGFLMDIILNTCSVK